MDRALVVIGAGLGIVLANKGDLIDESVALLLLVIVAALITGAGLLSFHFELPGAVGTIDAFSRDLEHHSEVLSVRDIEAVRGLPSLTGARQEVQRARRATAAVIFLALAALVFLFIVLIVGTERTEERPPTTTTMESAAVATSGTPSSPYEPG